MSDVTIKYNNNTIGELNDTGTAVLQTANKKCVSNIEMEYTKSAGNVGGLFVISMSKSGSTYTADKTITEINEAITAGMIPVVLTPTGYRYCWLMRYTERGMTFATVYWEPQSYEGYQYVIEMFSISVNDPVIYRKGTIYADAYESNENP